MKRIAQFEKVSFDQFYQSWVDTFYENKDNNSNEERENNIIDNKRDEIFKIYEDLKLPQRATVGSAGYDFYSPLTFALEPGEMIKIPTGIRVRIDEGWVLKCYPRSGLGFKFRLQMNNTVGIIDSDYYHSDNEGHIFAKITNDTKEGKTLTVDLGMGFMQGIFVEYGITIDDEVEAVRNGGFGSTSIRG